MSTNDDYSEASGPGKFEGNAYPRAAAQVYDWSLEWQPEQMGSVDELGWFGFLDFDDEHITRLHELGYDDDGPTAAIVGEDQQGFVTVTFYDNMTTAMDDWTLIDKDYQNFYDEQEDDDNEHDGLIDDINYCAKEANDDD